MSEEITLHHIRSVTVNKLFGRYSYTLPEKGKTLSELNIFYASNGAGKTTLLSLIFHMLSPSDRSGHRTTISETPFQYLEISLNDGTVISARKDPQLLIGPVTFEIVGPSQAKIQYHFLPNEGRTTIRIEDLPPDIDIKKIPVSMRDEVARAISKRDFHVALGKISVVSYMLTSDRILMSDALGWCSKHVFRWALRRDIPHGDDFGGFRVANMGISHL